MFNDTSNVVINEALFQHYSFENTRPRFFVETLWSNDKGSDTPLGLFQAGLMLVKALDIFAFSLREEHAYF